MKFIIKLLVWIPPVIIAMLIFGFSSQNATESSGLSSKAAATIVQFAGETHIVKVNDTNKAKLIENLEYPIRKCAHMTEYLVFTLSVMNALYVWNVRKKLLYLASFAVTVLFAGTDEFHQLFVPGRSGRFSDVLVDATGAAIGFFFVWCISRLISKKK